MKFKLLVCVCFSERQKKKQLEQIEDRIEELKEKLRVTQMQLQTERETEKQVCLCLSQDPIRVVYTEQTSIKQLHINKACRP